MEVIPKLEVQVDRVVVDRVMEEHFPVGPLHIPHHKVMSVVLVALVRVDLTHFRVVVVVLANLVELG